MTHDETPIVEVNQAIWLGRLDKDWSDKTDRHTHTPHTDLDIMTLGSGRKNPSQQERFGGAVLFLFPSKVIFLCKIHFKSKMQFSCKVQSYT